MARECDMLAARGSRTHNAARTIARDFREARREVASEIARRLGEFALLKDGATRALIGDPLDSFIRLPEK